MSSICFGAKTVLVDEEILLDIEIEDKAQSLGLREDHTAMKWNFRQLWPWKQKQGTNSEPE